MQLDQTVKKCVGVRALQQTARAVPKVGPARQAVVLCDTKYNFAMQS